MQAECNQETSMLQVFSKTMMTGAALLCLASFTNNAKADAAACPSDNSVRPDHAADW
jgi:hypothetical protein